MLLPLNKEIPDSTCNLIARILTLAPIQTAQLISKVPELNDVTGIPKGWLRRHLIDYLLKEIGFEQKKIKSVSSMNLYTYTMGSFIFTQGKTIPKMGGYVNCLIKQQGNLFEGNKIYCHIHHKGTDSFEGADIIRFDSTGKTLWKVHIDPISIEHSDLPKEVEENVMSVILKKQAKKKNNGK